jgi:murein DD-endopeptidase MepM/ murein hydrolase activator NlpD
MKKIFFVLIAAVLCFSENAQSYDINGFDYPIGNRGYDDNGNKVALSENITPETNGIYTDSDGYYGDNSRSGTLNATGWYNLSDVGNYVKSGTTDGLHPGEDWNYQSVGDDDGEQVYAVANGKVYEIKETFSSGYDRGGWTIILEHEIEEGNVVYSIYTHLTCVNNNDGGFDNCTSERDFDIQEDDEVAQGDVVARLAAGSEMSWIGGAHLHFEMRNEMQQDLYPNDNGSGYYTDTIGESRRDNMTFDQVGDAFALMHNDGIIDPSDFIDSNRTINNSPVSVSLNSPSDGATSIDTQTASFSWNSENATHHRIVISKLADFSGFNDGINACGSTCITGGTTKDQSFIASTSLEPGTQYYWHVRAANTELGVTTDWTPSRSFITTNSVNTNIPDSPTLTISTSGLDVTASWTSVSGATGYTLYYAPYPFLGDDTIVSADMGTATDFSTTLWRGASFYVAITSSTGAIESEYSNIDLFTIAGPDPLSFNPNWSGRIEFLDYSNNLLSIPANAKIRITPDVEQVEGSWGGIVVDINSDGTWATSSYVLQNDDGDLMNYTSTHTYQFAVFDDANGNDNWDYYETVYGGFTSNNPSFAVVSDFNNTTITAWFDNP